MDGGAEDRVDDLADSTAQILFETLGGDEEEWELESRGEILVYTTSVRVAKVSPHPRNDGRLWNGVRCAHALAARGGPVVAPLQPSLLQTDAGAVSLWPRVYGDRTLATELSGRRAVNLGRALAWVSAQPKGLGAVWNPYKRVPLRLGASTCDGEETARAEALWSLLRDKVGDVSRFTQALSHGDVRVGSTLYFGDEVLLDNFEYCGPSPAGWDMACLLVSMGLESGNLEGLGEVSAAYIEAGGVFSEDPAVLGATELLLQATELMVEEQTPVTTEAIDWRLELLERWVGALNL
jgi:hypothetical protein